MKFSQLKTEIQNAPTVPLVDDARTLINKLLSVAELEESELFEFADLLFGLMSGLANVDAFVDHDQSALIVSWIQLHWKESDLEYIDLLITILTNLSPDVSKPFLDEKLNYCSNQDIKKMLLEGIEEIS
jgi:hypothetical protein